MKSMCPEIRTNIEMKKTFTINGRVNGLRSQVGDIDIAYEAYERSTETDARNKLRASYVQANDAVIPQILEAVSQDVDSAIAFELLEWVINNKRIRTHALQSHGFRAIQLLRDFHIFRSPIAGICRTIGWTWDPEHEPATEFLTIAAKRNPAPANRAYATFALARITKRRAENLAFRDMGARCISSLDQNFKGAFPNTQERIDWKVILHQAEQLFEAVLEKHADIPSFPAGIGLRRPRETLGEQAIVELYECRHLEVGKIAPEIEGEALNGLKFKLSDFRGHAVLLNFWASWCGPCMQLLAHERKMAARMEARPFAIVGVNVDEERADGIRAEVDQKITWRSFWNGGPGCDSIAGSWNVTGWPTTYILDRDGMIQLKFLGYGGKQTDALLDNVVNGLFGR